MSEQNPKRYFSIRPLQEKDSEGVLDLYNHYVRMSYFTFDTRPLTLAQRRPWFNQFKPGGSHLCFVAAGENDEIGGYACSTVWRYRGAYASSVEVSVYLREHFTGLGLGKRLYNALIPVLNQSSAHRAYALIALPNPASVKLHKNYGFKKAGVLSEAGRKFDRYWDVGIYEKHLL